MSVVPPSGWRYRLPFHALPSLRDTAATTTRPTRMSVDGARHFDNNGDMEKMEALAALAALSQETRLDIFRLLVQTGPGGLPAGHIGDRLGLPSATLAFHLKELKNARLATCTRNGRSLIYAAAYPVMNDLLSYLTENCCAGAQAMDCDAVCAPAAESEAARRKQRSA
jgi:ArsR family transcriptional regulator, arsenate/arsenite/antimonite-responsive transcriptional repressor